MENLEEIEEKFQNGNALFENQNYSQAINNYNEIKEKYSDQLSDNSKTELELAILKSHMKYYHQTINYPDEFLNEIENEINKSLEVLHNSELEDYELNYLEIEFNILIEKYDVALQLLEKCSKVIGETPDILLFYIIIYNKKNELSKCEQYFEKLDSLIIPQLTKTRILHILKNQFKLSSDEINQEIADMKENIGRGYLTDIGALFLIAGKYKIDKNEYFGDYEVFKKNNREEIIEQKSTWCVKQGWSGMFLEDLIAIDMVQNERFLEYNWALAKACAENNHPHEAISMAKWLLEKNFFNSKYHELLIEVLTETTKESPAKADRSVLLATARKWKNTFSNNVLDSEIIKNHDGDALPNDERLMKFLQDNQISLKKILVNLNYFDESVGPKYAGNCIYGDKSTLFEDSIHKKIKKMEEAWFAECKAESEMNAAMNEYQYDQNQKDVENEYEREIEEKKWLEDNDTSMDVDYSMNDDSFDTESFEKD